jgi:flagellar motility protein MotE (MotC chaperone)
MTHECPICKWQDGSHNSSCWIGALAIKWREALRELEIAHEAQRQMALELHATTAEIDAAHTLMRVHDACRESAEKECDDLRAERQRDALDGQAHLDELNAQLHASEQRVREYKGRFEEEYKIVDRCWKALGIETFEQASGKSITEIITDLRTQLQASEPVIEWAQATLTALNVGHVHSESPLHKKLREVMIAYGAAMNFDT